MSFVEVILIVILLFVNGTFEIMTNQIENSNFFAEKLSLGEVNLDNLTNDINNFLYSTDDEQIIKMTCVALVIVSIFFATVYGIIRFLSWIKNKKNLTSNSSLNENNVSSHDDKEDIDIDEDDKTENNDDYIEREENILVFDNQSINQNSVFEEDVIEKRENPKEKNFIPLDWERKKKKTYTSAVPNENVQTNINLRKKIRDLIHLIVNMLGRNIDELKIAQTIMFYKTDDWSEEAVMQLVLSVKEFINLCNRGAFAKIRQKQNLPTEEDAILHLLIGDTSYAMALMEALIDEQINFAINMKNKDQREVVFKQTSYYSCYFGTLAEVNDENLAAASFELALEMYPQNALAWSRCADSYKKIGLEERANQAYNNVLKTAIDEKEIPQKANAYKYLSQYLYANGDSEQALQLYTQSKSFYDSIGINRPMDRKELEIIEMIESANNENIVNSVLLVNQNTNSL